MSDHADAEFVEPGDAHGQPHPWHRPRVWTVSRLDRLMQRLPVTRSNGDPYYAAYRLRIDEHAATVFGSLRHSRRILDDLGFVYEPVAAVKTHPSRDIYTWGSYVLRPDAAPHAPDYVGDDEQLHVHLFPTEDLQGVEWHAHLEYCWRSAPRAHYNGEYYDVDEGRRLAGWLLELEAGLETGEDFTHVL